MSEKSRIEELNRRLGTNFIVRPKKCKEVILTETQASPKGSDT